MTLEEREAVLVEWMDERGWCQYCSEWNHERTPEDGEELEPCPVEALASSIEAEKAANRRLKALADAKIMASADLVTLGDGRDYALAAFMVRDLATTKAAYLYDLAATMAQDGGVSRGDWEGLREYWWRAWLAALTDRSQPEKQTVVE